MQIQLDKEKVAIKTAETLMKQGVTAIKVELEGVLQRGEEDSEYCAECSGEGNNICEACDGEGSIPFDESIHTEVDRMHTGPDCEHDCPDYNRVICDSCDGDGNTSCDYCDGGYVRGDNNWDNNTLCQDFILERLAQYGLAELVTNDNRDEYNRRTNDPDGDWTPTGALRFCWVYDDPSVDTECTMTLLLNKAENILLLPKLVEAFNALGDAVGHGVDINNAGMHTSLIFAEGGTYEEYVDVTDEDIRKYRNFKKSMALLMPALYFLGTTNENTRSLHFRTPQVARDTKFSAIHYVGSTLEFRLFDPCYDRPEQILDYVVVMKNCLRYWSTEYKDPGLSKITTEVMFGNDENNRVDRFYSSVQHIDLLNAGLAKLKPAYYTVKELKAQRNFEVNKRAINNREKIARREAEIQYREYDDRFEWNLEASKHNYIFELMRRREREGNPSELIRNRDTITKEVEAEAKEIIKQERANKRTLAQYVEDQVQRVLNRSSGNYVLSV